MSGVLSAGAGSAIPLELPFPGVGRDGGGRKEVGENLKWLLLEAAMPGFWICIFKVECLKEI